MKNLFLILLLIYSQCFIACDNGEKSSKKSIERSDRQRTIESKVALVIGNNDYEEGELTNAVNDAREIKNFLKSRDFEVIYSENADKKTMDSAISTFLDKLGSRSVGFVYFSGHGIQEYSKIGKRIVNYLIPIDNSKIKSATDLDYKSISLNYILDSLNEKGNGLNIVLLDSCRTPFKAFSKSVKYGLAPADTASGVFIAYATASGERALDNGLFRKSFIKNAKKDLKLVDIFENVKNDVYNQTQQTIFTSNGKRGVFHFSDEAISTNRVTYNEKRVEPSYSKKKEGCVTLIECNNLAKEYKRNGSYKNAKRYYLKSCEMDSNIACNELGWIYKKIDGDYTKAKNYFTKSCNLGYGMGCANIGWMYEEGKFLQQDYLEALSLYKKGCNLNEGYSCGNLAGMYQNGIGVNRDIDEAKKLYEKGCSLGDKKSCMRLTKIDKEDRKATLESIKPTIMPIIKRKCRSASGCKEIAIKYRKEKNFTKAKEYYLESCHMGDSKACNDLGWLYKKIDKNYTKAKRFYTKSCSLNYGLGCANIGWMYEEGKKISKNYKQAVGFYKKGCNLDNGNSCSSLGGMYKDAKGVGRDINRAKRLYKKACKLGNSYGCKNLKKL